MRGIYGGFFDVPSKCEKITALEAEMSKSDFWDNQTEAKKIVAELARLKGLGFTAVGAETPRCRFRALFELAEESDNDESLAAELAAETLKLHSELDKIEIESFLSGRSILQTRL